MKLLALSDIIKWEGYEKLVNEIKPDIVALIGDLTDDGFRPFYSEARKHVENFYKFLKYAGARARVLVVKGNHDKEEDYILEKINNIPGCTEISGKVIEIDSIRFLGLGYEETHYLRLLKPIVRRFKGKIDVVMFHGERLRLISSLEPKLILRGGYIPGKYLVQGIPSVWVSWQHHAIVTIENTSIRVLYSGPNLSMDRYEWIKPYNNKTRDFNHTKIMT